MRARHFTGFAAAVAAILAFSAPAQAQMTVQEILSAVFQSDTHAAVFQDMAGTADAGRLAERGYTVTINGAPAPPNFLLGAYWTESIGAADPDNRFLDDAATSAGAPNFTTGAQDYSVNGIITGLAVPTEHPGALAKGHGLELMPLGGQEVEISHAEHGTFVIPAFAENSLVRIFVDDTEDPAFMSGVVIDDLNDLSRNDPTNFAVEFGINPENPANFWGLTPGEDGGYDIALDITSDFNDLFPGIIHWPVSTGGFAHIAGHGNATGPFRDWIQLDGNFAIVPTPAAAGPGLIALGLLALMRRRGRREAAEA